MNIFLVLLYVYRGPAAASAVAVVPPLLRKRELMNLAVILSATPPITARTKSCALGCRNAFVNIVNCFWAFCKSSSPPVVGDEDDDDDAFA